MEALFLWVLNSILCACNYTGLIQDASIFSCSVAEAHVHVEQHLRQGHVLKPEETLKSFFERDDIQRAFQEVSITWEFRREYKDHFVKIMTQQ